MNDHMRIQEAAYKLLKEEGTPLSSKELAKRALDRSYVISNAKDPVFSHATTIEKNIRDGIYNNPKLAFVNGPSGRLIGMPEWGNSSPVPRQIRQEATIKIPADLLEKVRLAELSGIAETLEDTVTLLLRKGLAAVASDIKSGLMEKTQKLGNA